MTYPQILNDTTGTTFSDEDQLQSQLLRLGTDTVITGSDVNITDSNNVVSRLGEEFLVLQTASGIQGSTNKVATAIKNPEFGISEPYPTLIANQPFNVSATTYEEIRYSALNASLSTYPLCS